MTEPLKCPHPNCNPVWQTRAGMKPEDHHRQFARYEGAKRFAEDHGVALPLKDFRQDAYEVEDLGSEHMTDMRISCSSCGQSTGWDRRDTERYQNHGPSDNRRHLVTPDGNKLAILARWNDMVK